MTKSDDARRVRPQVIVAAILLVGAAVTLVLTRFWLDWPAVATDVADASVANPAGPLAPDPAPATEPRAEAVAPEPAAVADPTEVAPAAPIRIVVLPVRVSDPAAETVVESVRQGMLGAMRGMPDVEVVDVSAAELAAVTPANAGPLDGDRLAYLAVSGRYDSPNVVEISEHTGFGGPGWHIMARALRANGSSGSGTSISKDGNFRPGSDPYSSDPYSIGVGFAERIVRRASREPVQAIDDAQRAAIVDTLRPEEQRLQALFRLRADDYDSEVIAAAVDLATRSESAGTRARALGRLRQNVYDATLAQPLSSVLMSDPDAEVRKEAALVLAAYADDGSILPFLEYAQDNDSSADVRLAARMATMPFDEQQAFKRETLLDRSLTPAERLAPTTISNGPRMMMSAIRTFGAEQQEEVRAYAEIVAGTDDPELKRRSLWELQLSVNFFPSNRNDDWDPDGEIVDVLIDSVGVEDEDVRLIAPNVLRREADNPDVRAVLETVLEEEPELAAQVDIAEALAESD